MTRFVAFVAAAVLLVSGCSSQREINKLAIVSMIGVDLTESGETELWLSLVNPRHGAREARGPAFETVRGRGRSIVAAATRIQTLLPHRIYWGHTEIVIIGDAYARKGITPLLDYLARQREVRLSSYVLLTKDDLGEIMTTSTLHEPQPSKGLLELSRSGLIFPRARALELVELVGRKGQDPITGVVGKVAPAGAAERDAESVLRLSGTGLFQRDRLVGTLGEQLSRGLRWMREPIHEATLPVQAPEQGVVLSIVHLRSKVFRQASVRGGRLTMTVKVAIRGDVGDVTSGTDVADAAVLREVERIAAGQVTQEIKAAIARLKEVNADAAGFGEVVHRQLPSVWQQVSGSWRETGFRELEVIPQVTVRIEQIGVSLSPLTRSPVKDGTR